MILLLLQSCSSHGRQGIVSGLSTNPFTQPQETSVRPKPPCNCLMQFLVSFHVSVSYFCLLLRNLFSFYLILLGTICIIVLHHNNMVKPTEYFVAKKYYYKRFWLNPFFLFESRLGVKEIIQWRQDYTSCRRCILS